MLISFATDFRINLNNLWPSGVGFRGALHFCRSSVRCYDLDLDLGLDRDLDRDRDRDRDTAPLGTSTCTLPPLAIYNFVRNILKSHLSQHVQRLQDALILELLKEGYLVGQNELVTT